MEIFLDFMRQALGVVKILSGGNMELIGDLIICSMIIAGFFIFLFANTNYEE